jgi:hypothetical protein
VQRRAYHDEHHLSPLQTDIAHRNTMDFLPKAKGSWKEMNEQRQRVNNATLAFGVALLVSSLYGVIEAVYLFSISNKLILNVLNF